MTSGTTEKAAKNVTSTLVGRHNAITNHKGNRTNVVGSYAKGNILFIVCFVLDAGNFADMLHYVSDRVNLKKIVNVLHYAGKTFKTHSGIDILLFQLGIVAVAVIVKL